jgi:hypothetical protein
MLEIHVHDLRSIYSSYIFQGSLFSRINATSNWVPRRMQSKTPSCLASCLSQRCLLSFIFFQFSSDFEISFGCLLSWESFVLSSSPKPKKDCFDDQYERSHDMHHSKRKEAKSRTRLRVRRKIEGIKEERIERIERFFSQSFQSWGISVWFLRWKEDLEMPVMSGFMTNFRDDVRFYLPVRFNLLDRLYQLMAENSNMMTTTESISSVG